MRFHSDLMQVLVFIIIFIVIHIIIIHHTNRSLNVTLKHKIVLEDGPVIHLKSASRSKLKEAAEKEYEEYNWEAEPVLLREKILSYPHHLKYSPVEDWPSTMDADERSFIIADVVETDNLIMDWGLKLIKISLNIVNIYFSMVHKCNAIIH